MSNEPGDAYRANPEPLNPDPTGQDPSAKDPAAGAKLRLQLAIFDVTRHAQGKSFDVILESLRSAFAAQGVGTPPGTWLESVASSAFYGEPYIIDFPAAVAADDAEPAPNKDIRDRLASRRELRELREEKLPAGTFPSARDWNVPADAVTHPRTAGPARQVTVSRTESGTRAVLTAVAVAMAVLITIRALQRSSRRLVPPTGSFSQRYGQKGQ
ncbi:hypothetical protein ACFFGR_05535 [Arthrobacter liuii]|nr:hypothetical protein [Arthrobacter liuii]